MWCVALIVNDALQIKKQSMHNVQGKVAEYLVGMLLRPILRGKGKVLNKLVLAEENHEKPLKSWKEKVVRAYQRIVLVLENLPLLRLLPSNYGG